MHAELAKLVVGIECQGSQREPNMSLGQEREQEAHLCTGGVSSQLQEIVTLSIGRKKGVEEDDDGSHIGGSKSPN